MRRTHAAIRTLIRKTVLQVPAARRIIAKSGARPGGGVGAGETGVVQPVIPYRFRQSNIVTFPSPVDPGFQSFYRYMQATHRRMGGSFSARQTFPITEHRSSFFVEGVNEIRFFARCRFDSPNLRIMPGFCFHEEYDLRMKARLPDTNVGVRTTTDSDYSPPAPSGVSPTLTLAPTYPYLISEWTPIHPAWWGEEVLMTMFVRNTQTSGSLENPFQLIDIQFRYNPDFGGYPTPPQPMPPVEGEADWPDEPLPEPGYPPIPEEDMPYP